MTMILAGQLRSRITIQQPSPTRTGSGATAYVYVDLLDCWAAVEQLSGRALYNAQQVLPQSSTRIRLRFRPGITAQMRVRHKRVAGSPDVYDYYSIDAPPIDPDGLRHEMHLLCTLRPAEGFRIGAPS